MWGSLAFGVGCASGPLTQLRFANRSPLATLDDRRPIAKPARYEPGELELQFHGLLRDQALHALAVPGRVPAQNVNALDEVPNSSWFANRIGIRPMTAAQIARGPGSGGPDLSEPLQILSSKQAGTAPGLVVEDARADVYLLKFDPTAPEAESGAEVVVQRLLWAAGYNVPDNEVVHFAREDLLLSPNAVKHVPDGREFRLDERDVDAVLATVPRGPDGRYRAMASKYLPGEPVGGFPMVGVRSDDDNDRIPHEHRREVRALRVFFAWLGHTDVKEANTLDTWIEQPAGTGLGHLVHHILDFGKALGVWGLSPAREADGYTPHFDYGYAVRSLLSFGLWRRPWEGLRAPGLRGVGRYDAEHFEPDVYSPANPYVPFLYTDRFDAFWAAKTIARFGSQHVAAAVSAGKYSDPRARRYLVKTILARGRKTARYWSARVNPLDRFEVEPGEGGFRICAVDLLLEHALGDPAMARHAAVAYDFRGRALCPRRQARPARDGRVCIARLPAGQSRESYTMVAFETFRGDVRLPPTIVHLARDPATARLRVIGVERR